MQKAPAPEQATGVASAEPAGAGNNLRVVPRVLLFPVRVALFIFDAPMRSGFWLYERYQLRDRFKAIFFNDTGTVGLYPVAFVETGFGLNAGARFIHRALWREASLRARASFGGRFRQIYALKLGSGRIFGDRIELELEAEHEIRPKDRFFGVGNGDEVEMVADPVDPYANATAVDSRFQQTLSRLSAIADVQLFGPVSARLSSAAMWRDFDRSDRAEILDENDLVLNYDTAALPGFDEGAAYSYHELELRIDTRQSASRYEMETVPSVGWLLSGFGGIATDFDRAPTKYIRYGADLQRYIRIGEAPRLLALRAYMEGVDGDLDEVPFVDLPRLGGPLLLRGYDQDRFRDRVLGLTSAEYQFDMGYMLTGYVFVDAGRVYPELRDIELKDIRVGYGGGIQLQTPGSFLGRVSVATSIDGGLLFNLSLDPVYDPKARVERK
ncbi:MAG TPA: BamA/TamA family outer membrane protein [Kofleriaceae bacterium]|nr:BamA/TamA family outer membrane protein [Kofleriaceae bacterium]